MFVKLGVIFLVLQNAAAHDENQDWELAVVTDDQIELLLSNGSLIGSAFRQFNKLKALTFDNLRHRFVVSDMDQQNDTIFTVQLDQETDIKAIVEDLPDDVQGLAIDPVEDILYWTDSINRTINYLYLNDSSYQSNVLFAFTDKNPQGIAVDVCHRYIYWTNSDINRPTVERSRLDGSEHEVLVEVDIHRPAGISVDYQSRRIFWADIKEGIYYTIESTNLEGKERQVLHLGTHSKPFGVAVDAAAVYWTDVNANALWKMSKGVNCAPQRLRHFKGKPFGVIARNLQVRTLPDCGRLSQVPYEEATEAFRRESDKHKAEESFCLNGGRASADSCDCPRGYVGRFCETSLCYNYCVHGDCRFTAQGYSRCRCFGGFAGSRCERDLCEAFCLNGGVCSRKGGTPRCDCREGFDGSRCEISPNICTVVCQEREDGASHDDKAICRCVEGSADGDVSKSIEPRQLNFSSHPSKKESSPFLLQHLEDPIFLSVSCLWVATLVIIGVLIRYIRSLRRRRRPRIKKRIIVNKNITPLASTPGTEHCEITIEDCCNMNICETPCFEPPQLTCLQSKSDDKKKLLANIEIGEGLQ